MSLVALPEPDAAIMSRRGAIVDDLRRLVGADAVIADEDGRRAYETDALTAYRRLPLAVVLPASTEEVSRVLAYCHQRGIKVVARGAGTSLSGGALPSEDAVVVGVSAHEPGARDRLHEPHRPRRGRHHQPRHQRRSSRRETSSTLRIPRASSPARWPATSA